MHTLQYEAFNCEEIARKEGFHLWDEWGAILLASTVAFANCKSIFIVLSWTFLYIMFFVHLGCSVPALDG